MKTKAAAVLSLITFFTLTVILLTQELGFELFNLLEGFTWLALALFVLTASQLISKKYKCAALFTVVILALFSVSDFLEVTTGAYWQPWWLLGLNSLCILGIVGALAWFAHIRYCQS